MIKKEIYALATAYGGYQYRVMRGENRVYIQECYAPRSLKYQDKASMSLEKWQVFYEENLANPYKIDPSCFARYIGNKVGKVEVTEGKV